MGEMVNSTDLWNACVAVLAEEKKPLEVSRVASATGLSEGQVVSMLIRESTNGRSASFRYPPLPCAAIVSLDGPQYPATQSGDASVPGCSAGCKQ